MAGKSRRVVLALLYDGSAFFGYQRQPGLPTVESVVLSAISGCEPEGGLLYSYSSRTDRGVSALWQTLSFLARSECSLKELVERIEGSSERIGVWAASEEAPPEFHARRWALWRDYVYVDEASNYECADLRELNSVLSIFTALRDHSVLYKDWLKRPREGYFERRILRIEVKAEGRRVFLWVRGESFPIHYVRRLVHFARSYRCGTGFRAHAELWRPGEAEGSRLFLVGVKYPIALRVLDPRAKLSRVFRGGDLLDDLISFLEASPEVLSPFSPLSSSRAR
ncbi:MAG: hypothetical protein QXU52_02065 [Fervidicoccaceae archaeon]